MAAVTESVDVQVPVSVAYQQWTRFESFPQFMDGVESVTQLDETHLHWKVTVGGAAREFDTVITEQRLDERVAWKSTDGTIHAGVATFHHLGENTSRVTVQIDWEPEGLAEHAGAVMGLDGHRVKADLARFKEFLEGHDIETGQWRGDLEPREW